VVEVPSYARGDAAGHGSFDCARLAPRFAQDDKANNGVPAIVAQLCSTGLRPAAQTRAVWAYVVRFIAMIVASIVATSFSCPLLLANASAVQTVNVIPARFTCARAQKSSPTAGASHAEHVVVLGRHAQGRVAAGGIENAGDGSGVNEAVLLGEGRRERKMDLDRPWLHLAHFRAQRSHELLARKALSYPLLEVFH